MNRKSFFLTLTLTLTLTLICNRSYAATNEKWNIVTHVDDFTNVRTIVLTVYSLFEEKRRGQSPSLIVTCKNKKMDLYIEWRDFFGQNTLFFTKIGDNKAEADNFSLFADSEDVAPHMKISFPNTSTAVFKEILKSNKLAIHAVPLNESPVTAIFDTVGLSDAIYPFYETCGW